MKLQIISDVHSEWHADLGREFFNSLPVAAPTLVMAGDIADRTSIGVILPIIAKRWNNTIYIPGNHEFYGCRPDDYRREVESFPHPNFSYFHDPTFKRRNKRDIICATLWFEEVPGSRENQRRISDSELIKVDDYISWAHNQNLDARKLIEEHATKDSVIITHHLPHSRSIHPKYQNEALNCFFYSNCENLIERYQPKLWIHGHTHESMDYSVGKTRIICNPFGYAPYDLNPNFNEALVVEV